MQSFLTSHPSMWLSLENKEGVQKWSLGVPPGSLRVRSEGDTQGKVQDVSHYFNKKQMWTGLKNLIRQEEAPRTSNTGGHCHHLVWKGKRRDIGAYCHLEIGKRGLPDRSQGCRAMKLLPGSQESEGWEWGVEKKTRRINIPISLLSSSKRTSCASYWPNPTGPQNAREPRRCIGEGQPPEHSTGWKRTDSGLRLGVGQMETNQRRWAEETKGKMDLGKYMKQELLPITGFYVHATSARSELALFWVIQSWSQFILLHEPGARAEQHFTRSLVSFFKIEI